MCTMCGTPEYMAPELINKSGHGKEVDCWALGVLLFEMLTGDVPFTGDNFEAVSQKVLAGKIDFPAHLGLNAKDIITGLLNSDKSSRSTAEQLKAHSWYEAMNWESLLQRSIGPPFLPTATRPDDASMFGEYPEDTQDVPAVGKRSQAYFLDFDPVLAAAAEGS